MPMLGSARPAGKQHPSPNGTKMMSLGRRTRLAVALAGIAAVGLAVASPSSAAPKRYSLEGGKGTVTHHPYGKLNGGILYDYLVYTPAGWTPSERLPLYVALHGCAMNAADMMSRDSGAQNSIAECTLGRKCSSTS